MNNQVLYRQKQAKGWRKPIKMIQGSRFTFPCLAIFVVPKLHYEWRMSLMLNSGILRKISNLSQGFLVLFLNILTVLATCNGQSYVKYRFGFQLKLQYRNIIEIHDLMVRNRLRIWLLLLPFRLSTQNRCFKNYPWIMMVGQ